jgi:putative oxidoreductase
MNKIFSPQPLWQNNGLVLLRIITGLLMAYHGLEVFDEKTIQGYAEWEVIKKMPAPLFMAYLGKGLELVTGIFLAIGFLTRLSALLMAINMLFICFKIGGGKFWYEDQHPFIFALLALVYFFVGPVKYSIDQIIFKQKGKYSSY